MIHLNQLADNRFILFDSEVTLAKAQTAVQTLNPLAIIIRQYQEEALLYHLFNSKQVTAWSAPPETPLTHWLTEKTQTPTRPAYSNAALAPLRCIVLDKERVIGFLDIAIAQPNTKARFYNNQNEDTPHPFSIAVECPEQIPLGETVSVIIELTQTMGDDASLPIAVPLNTTVDVVAQAKQGLTLVQKREGELFISDNQHSQPINIKIKATEIGEGRLRLLCFQNGFSLGELYITPQIVPAKTVIQGEVVQNQRPLPPLITHQPDLTLLIFEQMYKNQPSYLIRLTARDPQHELYYKSFGPIQLKTPQTYFQHFFKDIQGLSLRDANTHRRIRQKGVYLYETLFPPELQTLLWSLKEQIKTIQIMSEEAWIPWELLRLQGQENGRTVEGGFLCETFEMTRWFLGVPRRTQFPLKNMALVVPTDSGLRHTQDEWEYLYQLRSEQRQVTDIPATYHQLLLALQEGKHDVWHFTGHGRFNAQDPNLSTLALENEDTLCVEDISGIVSNCGLKRPLVFFNACQTGQGGLALTGIGGWAKRFVDIGASAFVGSLWNIGDKGAHAFTKAFYDHFLSKNKPTIGAAVKHARKACQEVDLLSGLGYTVFADPLATIE